LRSSHRAASGASRETESREKRFLADRRHHDDGQPKLAQPARRARAIDVALKLGDNTVAEQPANTINDNNGNQDRDDDVYRIAISRQGKAEILNGAGARLPRHQRQQQQLNRGRNVGGQGHCDAVAREIETCCVVIPAVLLKFARQNTNRSPFLNRIGG
jgi:hypothetical protein